MIESGRGLTGSHTWTTDVVVVGTGAGGAMAASELARRGLGVIALEEGPMLLPPDMTQREDEMMPKLYQERGGRSTRISRSASIGGRCVGGSTIHNINLCKRLAPGDPRALGARPRGERARA